jgi:hypothetical protein
MANSKNFSNTTLPQIYNVRFIPLIFKFIIIYVLYVETGYLYRVYKKNWTDLKLLSISQKQLLVSSFWYI